MINVLYLNILSLSETKKILRCAIPHSSATIRKRALLHSSQELCYKMLLEKRFFAWNLRRYGLSLLRTFKAIFLIFQTHQNSIKALSSICCLQNLLSLHDDLCCCIQKKFLVLVTWLTFYQPLSIWKVELQHSGKETCNTRFALLIKWFFRWSFLLVCERFKIIQGFHSLIGNDGSNK